MAKAGFGGVQRLRVSLFVAVALLFIAAPAFAAAPTTNWIRQFGTSEDERGESVAVDGSGNIYVAGWTGGALYTGANQGGYDAFVTRYSAGGVEQWTRQFGGVAEDKSYSVAVDGDGNVYVTGYTYGDLDGTEQRYDSDAFIRKYDDSGTVQWTKRFGTTSNEFPYGIAVDVNGNAYVTGYTAGSLYGQAQGSGDLFIVKFNTSGLEQWWTQSGTAEWEVSYGIAVDANGNVYIAGYTDGSLGGSTNQGFDDVFVAKYNASGTHQWTRQFGTAGRDQGRDIAVDGSGNIYVTGYTYGSLEGANQGWEDVFIRKYDSSGAAQWTKQFGTGGDDMGYGCAMDTDGNVYMTGQINNDVFIRKYSESGVELWSKEFGSSMYQSEGGHGIAVDVNGNVYVTGVTWYGDLEGTSLGNSDAFIAAFSQSGTTPTPTSATTPLPTATATPTSTPTPRAEACWNFRTTLNPTYIEIDGQCITDPYKALQVNGDSFCVTIDGVKSGYYRLSSGDISGTYQDFYANSETGIASGCLSLAANSIKATITVVWYEGGVSSAYYDLGLLSVKSGINNPLPSECTADDISVSPFSLTLKKKEKMKNAITVTVTGEDNCKVEGEKITAKVDSAGKKLFSVTPAGRKTKEDGTAVFSVKAKRKTGNATVTFSTGGGLSESLDVTVTK